MLLNNKPHRTISCGLCRIKLCCLKHKKMNVLRLKLGEQRNPWGLHSTEIVSHRAALGSILSVPMNFSLDVAEIY